MTHARAAGGAAPAWLQPHQHRRAGLRRARAGYRQPRRRNEAQVRAPGRIDARELGFSSVSFDLIYGLPLQTADSLRETIDAIDRLRPDDVSFLSLCTRAVDQAQPAPVHRSRPAGCRCAPSAAGAGTRRLRAAGFVEIGIDQYAQPRDPLARAAEHGALSRNFMGYAASASMPLIGLGVPPSATLAPRLRRTRRTSCATRRGWIAANCRSSVAMCWMHRTCACARIISGIATRHEAKWPVQDRSADWFQRAAPMLAELRKDGLIDLHDDGLRVTERGRPFLRNVCMAFDARAHRAEQSVRNDAA